MLSSGVDYTSTIGPCCALIGVGGVHATAASG
jgi:hypothetical protein